MSWGAAENKSNNRGLALLSAETREATTKEKA
jgi:hypothetical protein